MKQATNTIQVQDKLIGPDHKPFIIAEMSGNHNGSLDRALEIVDAAAKAGADALKIQTYTADTMTLDLREGEFFISDPDSLWKGHSLYELYEKAHTPWDWHQAIFERCKAHGMVGFSAPFDASAVDFLEELDIPIYKIASFENIDTPLIKKIASTSKPVIMSTGMANISELGQSVATLREHGCKDIILLKCTSSYPASPENSNLLTIPHMCELFGVQVGLSDHTMGIGAAVASVALGATVIEKHFTLDRSEGGVDADFSLEPSELKDLVIETERSWQALGKVQYGPSNREKKSMVFRRSLYIAEDTKAGDTLTPSNLRAIRPGYGLPPKYYELMLGKKIAKDAPKGTPLSWDLLLD